MTWSMVQRSQVGSGRPAYQVRRLSSVAGNSSPKRWSWSLMGRTTSTTPMATHDHDGEVQQQDGQPARDGARADMQSRQPVDGGREQVDE